jgi:hypothetical protein
MRIALTAILGWHGLIHALGVLKWWKLAPVAQLSGRTLVPPPSAAHGRRDQRPRAVWSTRTCTSNGVRFAMRT